MLHKTTLLASGLLATLMLTAASSYADSYYAPAQRDYYQGQTLDRGPLRKAAKRACKSEIRNQIQSDRRHVQEIKFNRDSFDIRDGHNEKTRVSGRGQLLTGKHRRVDFDFKCTYNSYNDRITRASYSKKSDDWNKPDYSREMPQACKREIQRHILRNHGSATHIKINNRDLRQWRESRAETGFSGHGRFTGGRGRARHFEFSCIYNHRQDYTRNAWVAVN